VCGIFGYYHRGGATLDPEALAAMGNSIRHRGPDAQGVFAAPGVALGNQRLSIIDVQGGHQPFVSEDGQIIVVQNGEIFNHVELAEELARAGHHCRTHSDTEVLLRLYEAEGIGFISKLNGMFAIAIYDARVQALYLVRDRIGVKPLYIHDDGYQLTFGSEIKAILRAGIPAPAMDREALNNYLSFNYVPPPHTLYQGVRHLMPGHVMKITRDATTTTRWWDLAKVQPIYGRAESEWIEEFNAILDDSVRLRLRSDVPFGAFLSGGVDSSTIVGLMARYLDEPVKTYCIGFHDPCFDESSFALEASERFGTRHVMERVEADMLALWPLATYHCDQPHGDISFLPTYRVSELAARDIKVVLTGDGGDELFAGYDKYKQFFSRSDLDQLNDDQFQRTYFDSISLFDRAAKSDLYTPAMADGAGRSDSFEMVRPWFDSVPHQDRVNQVLFLDMQLLLSGNNLVKPDRMGMAVSLEARTPFLDYRMMEFAFRMPGELKLRGGETKYLYKKAVAPLIGERLAYRRKQMFTVPVGDWFRKEKAVYCAQNLVKLRHLNGLINISVAQEMLADHVDGRSNYTRRLRALVALTHWMERC
jgi:asparagine synthase (glutamine-hydrolysing)